MVSANINCVWCLVGFLIRSAVYIHLSNPLQVNQFTKMKKVKGSFHAAKFTILPGSGMYRDDIMAVGGGGGLHVCK